MWGRPNSVTIIDNSMHTAAEVEFGNFLTMMYFENTSATIRKSIQVVPMIGCDFPYSWHMMHFSMSCWMS